MPTSPIEVYFPVLLQAVVGLVIASVLVTVAWVLGYRGVRNKAKDTAYECGVDPTGTAEDSFSVRFYLVAMLFIVFDIEAVFLYPWVVVFRDLKWLAFAEMFIFVAFIMSGFFYIWKKGVLNWAKTNEAMGPANVHRGLPPGYSLSELEPPRKPRTELAGAGK
jgi:NADH-quinone oxidoreductase subunit A